MAKRKTILPVHTIPTEYKFTKFKRAKITREQITDLNSQIEEKINEKIRNRDPNAGNERCF